ncbi:hypothetical protein AB0M46_17305 [Dactylosporangium sp. NPDC051485]|uniref:hypothetical protein n=1 Tax=Dactylosporangium sp. NPDC051485 TaxID=3154846 RepID=UPI003423A94C
MAYVAIAALLGALVGIAEFFGTYDHHGLVALGVSGVVAVAGVVVVVARARREETGRRVVSGLLMAVLLVGGGLSGHVAAGFAARPGRAAPQAAPPLAPAGPVAEPARTPTAPVATATAPLGDPPSPRRADVYEPGHGNLVLDDPLTSDRGVWTNPDADGGTCRIAGDGLHVTGAPFHECFGGVPVADFTFEVTFRYATGTAAAVCFRQGDATSPYCAQFTRDGAAVIAGPGGVIATGSGPPSGIDGVHTLAVVAAGTSLRFYVDRTLVASGGDGQFTSGRLGVMAVGGEIVFRDARVWQAA